MKKSIFFKIYYILTLLIVIINAIFMIKNNLFFSINDLPKGKFQYSTTSNDKQTTINVYLVENSIGKAIRLDSTDNITGLTHNIYWQTDLSKAQITWTNNKVIVINGMPLNVIDGGYYDCRRGLSIILDGALYSKGEN